jgi:hypothetical protein
MSAAVLTAALFAASPERAVAAGHNVRVRVIDLVTQEPIPAATVEIRDPKGAVARGPTNAAGIFDAKGIRPEGESLLVECSMPGYEPNPERVRTTVLEATKAVVQVALVVSDEYADDYRLVGDVIVITSGAVGDTTASIYRAMGSRGELESRLRQDPRSRVIIIGHADSGERYPEVYARRRAEAAKDYLVRERGVEEARITTRSAGATRPLDPGTDAPGRARNRRVEVIFVREGAVIP